MPIAQIEAVAVIVGGEGKALRRAVGQRLLGHENAAQFAIVDGTRHRIARLEDDGRQRVAIVTRGAGLLPAGGRGGRQGVAARRQVEGAAVVAQLEAVARRQAEVE